MKNKISSIINSCGIKDVGFCTFSEVSEKLLDCRALQRIPENAKTVILLLFPYKVRESRPQILSRYAAVPDYLDIGMRYLKKIAEKLKSEFPSSSFEPFIDNSPIPEVYAAAVAGLGLKGENGLLINEKYGSFVFIGEIVTDIEIECQNTLKNCSMCGDCKNACPTGVHGAKCLSSLSQQKNGLTDEDFLLLKQNKILWGCDICAEVCPLNINAELTYIPEFINGYKDTYEYGEDISGRAYAWRGEKVIKRNYENLFGM